MSADEKPVTPAAQFARELAMLIFRWGHEADLSYAEIVGVLAAAQHKVIDDALRGGDKKNDPH